LWEQVQSLLDYLDEMFTLHPSLLSRTRSLRVAFVPIFVLAVIVLLFILSFFVFRLSLRRMSEAYERSDAAVAKYCEFIR